MSLVFPHVKRRLIVRAHTVHRDRAPSSVGNLMTLPRGLYDLVLTETVARSLDAIPPDIADLREVDRAEFADRLVESLGRQLRKILDELDDDGDNTQAHAQ